MASPRRSSTAALIATCPFPEAGSWAPRSSVPTMAGAMDAAGICRRVPALCGDPEGKARRVRRYRVVEQQRFVWVHMAPDEEPNTEPFSFPHMDDDDYVKIHYSADFEATLHATAENILDVPHTAFLHRGFFRGRKNPSNRGSVEAIRGSRRSRVHRRAGSQGYPRHDSGAERWRHRAFRSLHPAIGGASGVPTGQEPLDDQ